MKKLFALLAAFGLVFALAGCNKKEAEEENNEGDGTEEQANENGDNAENGDNTETETE